jgi:hypothetical protein
MSRRTFSKLLLSGGVALGLLVSGAPALAGASTAAKALPVFCKAVNAVGAVPTYRVATSSQKQAGAYSALVTRFSKLVNTAANDSFMATTTTNFAFSTDWSNMVNSVNNLDSDAFTLKSDYGYEVLYAPKYKAAIVKAKGVLEKQIVASRRVLAIALTASAKRGCKLG